MSKLERLIDELCPNGVEWSKLGNCCNFQRGTTITAKEAVNGDVPVIAGGLKPAYYHNVPNRKGDVISVAGSGAYAGYVSFWNIPVFISDAFTVNPGENLIPKYVFYFLKNIQQKIFATKKGSGVPHVHGSSISKFEIPIPPLPVQEEIVRILDAFTDYTAELQAEMQAELQARREQYEYYRNKLLSFEGDSNVEWKKLGDIAFIPNERISTNQIDKYVGVENLLKDKKGALPSDKVPESANAILYKCNDILIGNIRPYLKKIWLSDGFGGTNGDVVLIRVTNEYSNLIDNRYLYYLLSSDSFFEYDNQYAKGGKMPRGDKQKIMEYCLPIPPLSEQKRIVAILDKFEALVNDLTEGLPAEIAARQEQYEYYRDKLLSFPKAI